MSTISFPNSMAMPSESMSEVYKADTSVEQGVAVTMSSGQRRAVLELSVNLSDALDQTLSLLKPDAAQGPPGSLSLDRTIAAQSANLCGLLGVVAKKFSSDSPTINTWAQAPTVDVASDALLRRFASGTSALHNVLSLMHAPPKQAEQPGRLVIDSYQRRSDLMAKVLDSMLLEQSRRNGTLGDLSEMSKHLSALATSSGKNKIDSSKYDETIVLDPDSPTRQGSAIQQTKSLADLLIEYGLIKDSSELPSTKEKLEALVEQVNTKIGSLTSNLQLKNLELNKMLSQRDQAFTMISNVLHQLIEVLLEIVKRIG